jgi:RNA polymerase sigma factor (sigma-70 family)
MRIARRRTTNEHEAEDVVSEVLLRSVQALPLDDEALARWLTAVTINVCADVARDRRRSGKRALYSVRQLLPEPSPEQVILDREAAAAAVRRLNRLPSRQREALLLRTSGFTIEEIARELDVSYKTAESLLSRARTFMRKAAVLCVGGAATMLRLMRRHAKTAPVLSAAALVVAVGTGPWLTGPGANAGAGPTTGKASWAIQVAHISSPPRPAATPARAPARVRGGTVHAADGPGSTRDETRQVVQSSRFSAGRTHADTPWVRRQRPDETALQTLRRCLHEGPQVTPTYVGCPQ